MRDDFDNASWVEAHLKRTLTPFQKRVAEIIGIISSNAYNAPVKWEKVEWQYGYGGVCVPWERSLATYDFQNLTTLVMLCHDARIRLEIGPYGMQKGLRLCFWQRQPSGGMSKRHPNLEEAVADHREWIPHTSKHLYANHPEREFERAAAAMGAKNVEPKPDTHQHQVDGSGYKCSQCNAVWDSITDTWSELPASPLRPEGCICREIIDGMIRIEAGCPADHGPAAATEAGPTLLFGAAAQEGKQ